MTAPPATGESRYWVFFCNVVNKLKVENLQCKQVVTVMRGLLKKKKERKVNNDTGLSSSLFIV